MDNLILSQIPLQDLLNLVKQAVREEMAAGNTAAQPNSNETKYLSRHEVANLYKISIPTLRVWTKSGRVKGHRIGRRVLYKPSEVDNALKAMQTAKD